LFSSCGAGQGAMVRHAGRCEPLAAVYPADALIEVEAQLRAADHSLQQLARTLVKAGRIRLMELAESEASRLLNVNDPSAARIDP
jgi:molybdopterin-guanine dinucleotide biosynthesis protein A